MSTVTKRIGALIVIAPDQARAEILAAIDAAKGNRTHAAATLGVPVMTLRKWIDRLALWPAIDELCQAKGYHVQPDPKRKARRKVRKTAKAIAKSL